MISFFSLCGASLSVREASLSQSMTQQPRVGLSTRTVPMRLEEASVRDELQGGGDILLYAMISVDAGDGGDADAARVRDDRQD